MLASIRFSSVFQQVLACNANTYPQSMAPLLRNSILCEKYAILTLSNAFIAGAFLNPCTKYLILATKNLEVKLEEKPPKIVFWQTTNDGGF